MINNYPGSEPSPEYLDQPTGRTQILPSRPSQRGAKRPVSIDDNQGQVNPGEETFGAVRTARGRVRHLTIADICAELDITRSTFYDWRAKRKAPPCFKLPNGEIRIRRIAFDNWLSGLEEGAA